MAHVCLKGNGIILVETLAGLEEWDSLGYIIVFGVENTIQNGNLSFGKRKNQMTKHSDQELQEFLDEFINEWDIILDEEEKTLEMTLSQTDLAKLKQIRDRLDLRITRGEIYNIAKNIAFPNDDGKAFSYLVDVFESKGFDVVEK